MILEVTMSPIATTILEKVQDLPSAQQQIVLEFIELLEEKDWETLYQGRFAELRQEIQIGLEASARGEVIAGDVMFAQLRQKLQARRAAVES
jgi:antitoxin ParD1/3/4